MDSLRLLVVSDIHSNHAALRAVLDDAAPWDVGICAGDTVGYGPDPNECVSAVRENGFECVMGNHDYEVQHGAGSLLQGASRRFRFNPHAARAVEINRELLAPGSMATLKTLPKSLRLEIQGADIAVYHGSPQAPLREYVMPDEAKRRAAQLIAEAGSRILILGHTHKPYTLKHRGALLLNPGSVGQPRDSDPRASYALVQLSDGEAKSIIRRVEYDIETTQTRMREKGLPEPLATRLRVGL